MVASKRASRSLTIKKFFGIIYLQDKRKEISSLDLRVDESSPPLGRLLFRLGLLRNVSIEGAVRKNAM